MASAHVENAVQRPAGTPSIGLQELAADGTILWANPAEFEALGYTAAEYIGRNIQEFHADPQAFGDLLKRSVEGECFENYETFLRCKDGSMRKAVIAARPRFNNNGQFLHVYCFTFESKPCSILETQIEALSSEIDRLRLAASRERALLDSILTQSPHGIIVCDQNGKFILHNKACERIWAGSATPENVEGWGKYRAFHPDGRPYQPEDWAMARCLSRRETVQAEEVHFQRFDDTHGMLLGSCAPMIGANGELEGAVAVFADISQFKAQEEEIRVGAERFLTTLKSIGDAVIATDSEGIITFMNPVAERLTRWSLDEARGKPLTEVFHIIDEKTRKKIESPIERVRHNGTVILGAGTILIRRDGAEMAIDDSVAPIYNNRKELAGVVLVFRDVTQKRREDARRQFITEAVTLLASSLDYVPTLDAVAKLSVPAVADWCAVDIVEANGEIVRLAASHVDSGKEQKIGEMVSRYPRNPRSPYAVHEVLRTGKPKLVSEVTDAALIELASDDEHLCLLRELGFKSSMIVPLRGRDRTLGTIMFVAAESDRQFDMHDLAVAQELADCAALAIDNARLYREAQQANRAKDEFLATISHELRTPLNAVFGWVRLLRTSQMAEEKRTHALEVIERNTQAQARLIEDLLDVSRIVSGKLRLETQALDLVSIIEAAADAVRPAMDAKGIELKLFLEEQARPASGDARRLQQVIWNLLLNAVKFTGKGGVITVRLFRVDSRVEIQVTDTGIGIDPELLPNIFEIFKQGNSKTAQSQGGLGLGLAIVRQLVELHGGTVIASSDGRNKGSTFRVRLPVAAALRMKPSLKADSSPSLQRASVHGLRVLLVDDEEDARVLIKEILESHGAHVTAVCSAKEALQKLKEWLPDILVSDIGMPGEDGYSLIRKVRQFMENSKKFLPAAALTAYASKEDQTRSKLAGFQSHIVKPVDPEELVTILAQLTGRAE